MGWIARFRDDVGGSALVEAAVITPVLCTIFFGVFEFSNYFYRQHLMTTGVRDAARYIARSLDPTGASTLTSARNLATTGTIDGSGSFRVVGWDPNALEVAINFNNIDNSAGTYRGGNIILVVTVTGSFPYPPLGFWGFFGFAIPNVSVSHSERVIGPG